MFFSVVCASVLRSILCHVVVFFGMFVALQWYWSGIKVVLEWCSCCIWSGVEVVLDCMFRYFYVLNGMFSVFVCFHGCVFVSFCTAFLKYLQHPPRTWASPVTNLPKHGRQRTPHIRNIRATILTNKCGTYELDNTNICIFWQVNWN